MITKDREYRAFDFETKEDEQRIEGVPAVTGQDTLMYEIDGIEFYERIEPGAFDGADMSDVVLNVDHGGKPAAKTKNGTLSLEVRDDGLYMGADLSRNATGRELYEDIKAGFFDKMSFAFTIADESYDKESRTRIIRKIKRLFDVSAVTHPAYSQTSLIARSWAEAEAEAEHKARELAESQALYKSTLETWEV
jgi:uncharacterized protein